VDVNVHPTKQEVKFEDDRLMYAYLQAAVKHALARYNIAPSLDFSLNPEIQSLPSVQLPASGEKEEQTKEGYLYQSFTAPNQAHRIAPSSEAQQWKAFYSRATMPDPGSMASPAPPAGMPAAQMALPVPEEKSTLSGQPVLTVQGSLLVTTVKSGLLLVHLRRARERIWYERLQEQWAGSNTPAQRLLFPVSMELPPADAALLAEVLPDLRRIGFDINPFGAGTFVVQGMPPGLPAGDEQGLIEETVDKLKHSSPSAAGGRQEQIFTVLSRKLSYSDTPPTQDALRTLIDELFACSQPEYTATGKKVFAIMTREELEGRL
jgi:DNA mismatch repair protein MutL